MERVQAICPYDLYQNAKKEFNPSAVNSQIEEIVEKAIEGNPVTLIALPGIFGEFIDVFPAKR